MKNNGFPSKNELQNAILAALNEADGLMSTISINKRVAEILNLSNDILLMEDENGVDTAYNYRMRWMRTELKKKNLISNPKRGEWNLTQNNK